MRVRLPGETEPTDAELVASDRGNDLALLRIDRDGLAAGHVRPTPCVGLGDEVIAIGFALEFDGEPTVTLGIVSAVDRTIITRTAARSTADPARCGDLVGQLRRSARRRRRADRRDQHGGRPQ